MVKTKLTFVTLTMFHSNYVHWNTETRLLYYIPFEMCFGETVLYKLKTLMTTHYFVLKQCYMFFINSVCYHMTF